MAVAADTHVINSNMVNVARAGYMRFDGNLGGRSSDPLASDIGTHRPPADPQSGHCGAGHHGGWNVHHRGCGNALANAEDEQLHCAGLFSLMRHNQFIRIGGEVKHHQVMVDAPFSVDGLLDISTFDDFLLGESAQQNGSPNALSNVTTSGGSSGLFHKDERYTDLAGFVQDDLRLTSRLTVNAGVRYEVFSPPSEIHGRLVTFDPTAATLNAPASGTFSGFVVSSNFRDRFRKVSLVRRGAASGQRTITTFLHGWGLAYRLAEEPAVVVRGGFGIYFDRLSGSLAKNLAGQPPFSTSQFLSGSQNAGATLEQPFSPSLPGISSYPIFTPRVPGGGPSVVGFCPHTW